MAVRVLEAISWSLRLSYALYPMCFEHRGVRRWTVQRLGPADVHHAQHSGLDSSTAQRAGRRAAGGPDGSRTAAHQCSTRPRPPMPMVCQRATPGPGQLGRVSHIGRLCPPQGHQAVGQHGLPYEAEEAPGVASEGGARWIGDLAEEQSAEEDGGHDDHDSYLTSDVYD